MANSQAMMAERERLESLEHSLARTERLLSDLAAGEMLEVDPEHADALGAFEDDALSEQDALESSDDMDEPEGAA